MTTWNKIILKTIPDAVYIPLECVQAGLDSVQYVYKKNKTRQIVIIGDLNDKNAVVKEGLDAGTEVYIVPPADAAGFRLGVVQPLGNHDPRFGLAFVQQREPIFPLGGEGGVWRDDHAIELFGPNQRQATQPMAVDFDKTGPRPQHFATARVGCSQVGIGTFLGREDGCPHRHRFIRLGIGPG